MCRKILVFFVLFVFLITNSFANEIDTDEIDINSLETSSQALEIPSILSKSAIVLERKTLSILFEKSRIFKSPYGINNKNYDCNFSFRKFKSF